MEIITPGIVAKTVLALMLSGYVEAAKVLLALEATESNGPTRRRHTGSADHSD
jgi:hypothetical protein